MTRRNDKQPSRNVPWIPSEEDWGDYRSDLDWEYAHRQFAGRTNAEMLPHFRENVLMRSEDVSNMPEIPFRYYVLGFRDFVAARDFEEPDGSDAASCFLNLVLRKLQIQPDILLPIMPELVPTLRFVAENQALYGADESIYGSFRETLGQIGALYGSLRAGSSETDAAGAKEKRFCL
jgi:hypothetical protein